MVNIIICMKQVSDPEAPVSTYQGEAEEKLGESLALKLKEDGVI